MIDNVKVLPQHTVETLSGWVLAMDSASTCFCCGSPLGLPRAGVPSVPSEELLLECRRCGAQVFAAIIDEATPGLTGIRLFRRQLPVAA